MVAPKRGKPINFRMREESQQRFEMLHFARRSAGLNYNKSDILSEAIDLLYEKQSHLIKQTDKYMKQLNKERDNNESR